MMKKWIIGAAAAGALLVSAAAAVRLLRGRDGAAGLSSGKTS